VQREVGGFGVDLGSRLRGDDGEEQDEQELQV
jgi:hypothetical protein